MRQAKELEWLGVSASIARKGPLQGNGETDGYGRLVSTWGDFASRFWEKNPELTLEQVYEFLGLTNEPYSDRPQVDVYGYTMPVHSQRTIHNPNRFVLAAQKGQELLRFEREVKSSFEAEKEPLLEALGVIIVKLQGSSGDNDSDLESIEAEIDRLQGEENYIRAEAVVSSQDDIYWDGVWMLPKDHPDRQAYEAQQKLRYEALDVMEGYDIQLVSLQTKLKSMRDFGVAIPLHVLVDEMRTANIDGDVAKWDMSGTWRQVISVFLEEKVYDSGDGSDTIPPDIKAGDLFVTQEDIKIIKGLIKASDYELRQYGEACWAMIEPITIVPPLEDHPLVVGEGES